MNKLKQAANRRQWLQHVSVWSKSGLSQSAYCREHGLSTNLFSAWVGRAKKASVQLPVTSPIIVPLVVEPDQASDLSGEAVILLQHKSGWQLSLACDTSVFWLGRLLSQLV
jgi:transposase